VSYEEAELFAEQENLLFYECSAKTTSNLNEMFLHATNIIYSRMENREPSIEEGVFISMFIETFRQMVSKGEVKK